MDFKRTATCNEANELSGKATQRVRAVGLCTLRQFLINAQTGHVDFQVFGNATYQDLKPSP